MIPSICLTDESILDAYKNQLFEKRIRAELKYPKEDSIRRDVNNFAIGILVEILRGVNTAINFVHVHG